MTTFCGMLQQDVGVCVLTACFYMLAICMLCINVANAANVGALILFLLLVVWILITWLLAFIGCYKSDLFRMRIAVRLWIAFICLWAVLTVQILFMTDQHKLNQGLSCIDHRCVSTCYLLKYHVEAKKDNKTKGAEGDEGDEGDESTEGAEGDEGDESTEESGGDEEAESTEEAGSTEETESTEKTRSKGKQRSANSCQLRRRNWNNVGRQQYHKGTAKEKQLNGHDLKATAVFLNNENVVNATIALPSNENVVNATTALHSDDKREFSRTNDKEKLSANGVQKNDQFVEGPKVQALQYIDVDINQPAWAVMIVPITLLLLFMYGKHVMNNYISELKEDLPPVVTEYQDCY